MDAIGSLEPAWLTSARGRCDLAQQQEYLDRGVNGEHDRLEASCLTGLRYHTDGAVLQTSSPPSVSPAT